MVTCGTAAPLVAAVCVATTAVSTVYAVSNIAEGVSDIYYASKGDVTSEAFNPVKDLLEKAIGRRTDRQHRLPCHRDHFLPAAKPDPARQCGPAGGARGGSGRGGTILLVTRAVAVETLKIAATAAVSMVSSVVISDVTADLTGSQAAGMIAGFAGALFSGFLTYKGLTLLDQNLISAACTRKFRSGKFTAKPTCAKAPQAVRRKNWNAMSLAEKKSAVKTWRGWLQANSA